MRAATPSPTTTRATQEVNPPPLPGRLAERLRGARFAELVRSGYEAPARIFTVSRESRLDYLKVAPGLAGERARALWLAGRVRVPEVLAYVPGEVEHLLLSALPGKAADELAALCSPEAIIDAMARAARIFHAIDVTDCPFRADADALLAEAEAAVATGRVRQRDLSERYRDRSPLELLHEASRLRPSDATIVMTHGDLCLPNVVISEDRSCGFVDVGSAAAGDVYRDLSLLDRSLVKNLGARWSGASYSAYGIDRDPDRECFYALLDQLLMVRAA